MQPLPEKVERKTGYVTWEKKTLVPKIKTFIFLPCGVSNYQARLRCSIEKPYFTRRTRCLYRDKDKYKHHASGVKGLSPQVAYNIFSIRLLGRVLFLRLGFSVGGISVQYCREKVYQCTFVLQKKPTGRLFVKVFSKEQYEKSFFIVQVVYYIL